MGGIYSEIFGKKTVEFWVNALVFGANSVVY